MSRSLWMGGIALMLLSTTAVGADDPPKGAELKVGPVRVQVTAEPIEADDPPKGAKLKVGPIHVQVEAESIKLGDYWLGVGCCPAADALRSQLGLSESEGLVVENVVPDSPAAKAGIEKHDVLLAAGDKPLGKIGDLIEAIDATEEKPLAIELIRGGKKKSITATPAKRPEDTAKQFHVPLPEGADRERIDKWIQRIEPGPMQFRFFHPGAIVPHGAKVPPPLPGTLPGNMSVTIKKEGDKPAKIVVTRGDDSWEVTDEDLDELPEDIRPHVERILGNLGPGAGHIRALNLIPNLTMPQGLKVQIHERLKPAPGQSPAERARKQMEKRMEEMNRRIENIHKSLEELRERSPRRNAPKKDPGKV